jgi:hypothetical protein
MISVIDDSYQSSSLDLAELTTTPGQSYYVTVWPVNADGEVGAFDVKKVETLDVASPLTPSGVSFLPTNAAAGGQLQATVRNNHTSSASLVIRWYRNHAYYDEAEMSVAAGGTATFTLATGLETGDAWTFKAYARDDADGVFSRTYDSLFDLNIGSRVIGGTDGAGSTVSPQNVQISPSSPVEGDNLLCTATGFADELADAVNYTYQWYVNSGSGQFVASSGATSRLLASSLTSAGDVWQCRVAAIDSAGNVGTATISGSVTIGEMTDDDDSYEPNDEMSESREITSGETQAHTIYTTRDEDWFWFDVVPEAGYTQSTVTFAVTSTNPVSSSTDTDTDTDTDTTTTTTTTYPMYLELFYFGGSRIQYSGSEIDGTVLASIQRSLPAGRYCVRAKMVSNQLSGVSYWATLSTTPTTGTGTLPSAVSTVALSPAAPTTADDLTVLIGETAATGVSYAYVWYRDGEEMPFSTTTRVLDSAYTHKDESWTCTVYAYNASGRSAGVSSAAVTVTQTDWQPTLTLTKTYSGSVSSETQTVQIGWQVGGTHGYDSDFDNELPPVVSAPAGPVSVETPASGRFYSDGLEADHLALDIDLRPYGQNTSWYLTVEQGDEPLTCQLQWADETPTVDGTPLTITEVDPNNDYAPLGSSIDMLETTTKTISVPVDRTRVYRVTLGAAPGGKDAPLVLDLQPGWNLISLSVQPEDASVDSVFSPNGQKLIAGPVWKFVDGAYAVATQVETKVGYWVFNPSGEVRSIPVAGPRAMGDLELSEGWNLVGPAGEGSTAKPTDPAVIAVWGYENGIYTDADYLEEGDGYWMNATAPVSVSSGN